MSDTENRLDSLHIYESVLQFPKQCHQVIWEMNQLDLPHQFTLANNIVISGMGGSALGGRVIASLERQVIRVPVVVSTEYHLPNFVNHNSLVIISSYSGNTEETISSLAEARARNAHVFILCTGGKLAQIAQEQNIPHYVFDPKYNHSGQPRMGLGYNILAISTLLARCQLIHPLDKLTDLQAYLESRHQDLSQFTSLVDEIKGKIPILVSSEHLKGSAHCVKNMLNETSKNFSASFDIPELNHHLMEGLTFPKSNPDNLHFVFISSRHYHPEVLRRYPITKDVVTRQHISFSEINLAAPTRFFEVMELIQLGGFISFYLSQANGVDPGPIPWVTYFKDEVAKAKHT